MIGILKTEIKNIDKDFFAIKNLNSLVNTTTNGCLFCNAIDPMFTLDVRTNVLQRSFSHTFNGIIITDELDATEDLIHISYAKSKFLYLYRLDWLYLNNLQYKTLQRVLLHDRIELIARNKEQANMVADLFKKPKYIMNEWNYETLIEIDQNE